MLRRRRRSQAGALFATPPAGLAIHCVDDGGMHLVAPAGELDATTAWILERALDRAQDSRAREIVLDLGALELIDEAGVQVVVRASARSQLHDSRLVIRPAPASVQRSFELGGVADRLPFARCAAGIPLP